MNTIVSALKDPTRLSKLDELMLLDSPAEAAFDRLTRLASKILETPVSLVTLVDADRQFFKSQFGLPEPLASDRQTPLSYSFCQYVVETNEPLIVENARQHPVLMHNLATLEMDVVGYLGMPLTTTDGFTLGSFCVLDGQPRAWTEREIEIVRELALSVMTEIELRAQIQARIQVENDLRERNRQFQRVYHFASTTLRHIKETLGLGASKEELSTYLNEMERELARLSETRRF